MIVSAGVVLDGADAVALVGVVRRGLAATRSSDQRVLRLVAEIEAVARASRSGSVGTCAEPDRFRSRDGYVSVADAAKVFGISERAVRKRCASGSIACVKEGGRWLVEA